MPTSALIVEQFFVFFLYHFPTQCFYLRLRNKKKYRKGIYEIRLIINHLIRNMLNKSVFSNFINAVIMFTNLHK